MFRCKYGGEKGKAIEFVESQDLVVVRTTTADSLITDNLSAESKNLTQQLIPIGAFPEANVTIFKCVDKQSNNAVKVRNAVRKSFKKENSVQFAGRVLKDRKSGEPVVYTENFFIKFYGETSEEACEAIIADCQLSIKEALGFAERAYFVNAANGTGTDIFKIADDLLQKQEVEFCHPEIVREKKYKAIHPMQWHLKATQINQNFIDQHINVEAAWQTTKGKGITIAVIDDGIDMNHEEFGDGKIVFPRDTVQNLDDANPKSMSDRHGTPCAGVACGNGNFGASGVAPEAKLMPIRAGGLGSIAESKAFQWAADNGADVISCSWGPRDGPWNDANHFLHHIPYILTDSSRLALEYAIEKGRDGKGCIITWAAGNGNESADLDGYASYPKVIAVAACNDTGKRSIYSDYGQAVWCCFPSNDFQNNWPVFHPKPLSPGIWTTDNMGIRGYNFGIPNAENTIGDALGNYTATFGGTSSACPGVAGVIALMLAANGDLNWQEVKEIIKTSCDKIDGAMGNYDANGHSPFYGYGRINAEKAVQNALNAKNPVLNFAVSGFAKFNKVAEALLENGKPVVEIPDRSRLLGLQLNLQPFHPNINLEYKVIINRLGETDWIRSGNYAGTRDRRRKVIGFAIRLTGDLANNYNISYKAFHDNVAELSIGQNGILCGTTTNGGDSIEHIEIEIIKT